MHHHTSVLLNEAIDYLNINPNGIYIDATFGRGGHSRAIYNKLSSHGKLIVFDKDPRAIETANKIFNNCSNVLIIKDSFSNIKSYIDNNILISGILADLGVSSPQLDDPTRGFSFTKTGPLDMRMDLSQSKTAASIVNTYSEEHIAKVLWLYGEEKLSRKIARKIVEMRQNKLFENTEELALLIKNIYPHYHQGKHPATRTFQALRIEVNNELQDLEKFLEQAIDILKPKGRLVTICFHSLEYKIVKKFINKNFKDPRYPDNIPIEHHKLKPLINKIKTKLRPSQQEILDNPRARSAIMQVIEKN